MSTKQARSIIENALIAEGHSAEISRNVAFHMTDWQSDFSKLNELLSNPESMSSERVNNLLIDFLIHVPNHVAAASKLLLGIPVSDVFGVGATTESEGEDAI